MDEPSESRWLCDRCKGPHATYELKILLPFSEALKGEEVLKELDFIPKQRS